MPKGTGMVPVVGGAAVTTATSQKGPGLKSESVFMEWIGLHTHLLGSWGTAARAGPWGYQDG